MAEARRYLLLRLPTGGPPALAGKPNDFATLEEAEAALQALKARQSMEHHTDFDVMSYTGDKYDAMRRAGVLY